MPLPASTNSRTRLQRFSSPMAAARAAIKLFTQTGAWRSVDPSSAAYALEPDPQRLCSAPDPPPHRQLPADDPRQLNASRRSVFTRSRSPPDTATARSPRTSLLAPSTARYKSYQWDPLRNKISNLPPAPTITSLESIHSRFPIHPQDSSPVLFGYRHRYRFRVDHQPHKLYPFIDGLRSLCGSVLLAFPTRRITHDREFEPVVPPVTTIRGNDMGLRHRWPIGYSFSARHRRRHRDYWATPQFISHARNET